MHHDPVIVSVVVHCEGLTCLSPAPSGLTLSCGLSCKPARQTCTFPQLWPAAVTPHEDLVHLKEENLRTISPADIVASVSETKERKCWLQH